MKKYLFLFLIPVILTSCFGAKNRIARQLTVESNAIPPNIGKDSTYIVCILTGRSSRDKYLIKAFEDNYHGNFVFLDETRLKLDGYENIDKYRYVFNFHHHTSSAIDADGKMRTLGISEYYMYDRKLDKEYSAKYTSSMFGKYLKAYAGQLEKQRLANQ